jgi:hypothetical protein
MIKECLGNRYCHKRYHRPKRSETELIEAKVFAELATGIAEEEKINAENAAVIAENAVKQQFFVKYESRNT